MVLHKLHARTFCKLRGSHSIARYILITVCSAIPLVAASNPNPVDTSVREADLIVVGRIIGLSDTSPAAQSRRTREVHRIEVRETLKGNRPSQPEIAVRPTGQAWSDGESYVLFLRSLSPDNKTLQIDIDAFRTRRDLTRRGCRPVTVAVTRLPAGIARDSWLRLVYTASKLVQHTTPCR